MLRRFFKICLPIWAAFAAQIVYGQAPERLDMGLYSTLAAAQSACNLELHAGTDDFNPAMSYCVNSSTSACPYGNSYCTWQQLTKPGYIRQIFFGFSPSGSCPAGFVQINYGRCASTTQYPQCALSEWSDGIHCLTGTPYDERGLDENGDDEDGCNASGCPGDAGWRDSQGYDLNGFDENGLDRGGNSASEGGGYGGWAGTGGTPPPGWVPADPPDYGSGNNQDSNGIYQCRRAHPVSVSKSLVPGTVLDGLAGCGNGCQYQPSSIFYDFDYNEEVVLLEPNGYPCFGDEPSLSSIFVHQHSPAESHPEPANHLNFCYSINGFLWCKAPEDQLPSCYYQLPDGTRSSSVSCSMVQNSGSPSSEQQQVCGTKNGIYQCVSDVTNCASFQGEIICLDPDREPIDSNSPDHPINGGNADGNPFNDVFADSTDVVNNGWTVQQRQQSALSAQEIARAIDTALSDDFAKLTNQSAEIPVGDQAALNEAGLITDALQGVGDQDGIGFTVTPFGDINLFGSLLPTPQACEVFSFVLIEDVGLEFSIDTCQLTLFKTLAEWLVYAMTVLAFYRILITVREVR